MTVIDMMHPQTKTGDTLQDYVAFFEILTPDSLHRLRELCTPDVHFRDPFNDSRGIKPFQAALAKMFEDLTEPRFTVTDQAVGNQACYLRWIFTFGSKRPPNGCRRIEGISEIHLNAAGKVTAHIDHWDAGGQIYEQVPLLGSLVRMIRRQLSAGA